MYLLSAWTGSKSLSSTFPRRLKLKFSKLTTINFIKDLLSYIGKRKPLSLLHSYLPIAIYL